MLIDIPMKIFANHAVSIVVTILTCIAIIAAIVAIITHYKGLSEPYRTFNNAKTPSRCDNSSDLLGCSLSNSKVVSKAWNDIDSHQSNILRSVDPFFIETTQKLRPENLGSYNPSLKLPYGRAQSLEPNYLIEGIIVRQHPLVFGELLQDPNVSDVYYSM